MAHHKAVLYHLLIWVSLIVLFTIAIMGALGVNESIILSIGLFLPLIPAIYVHFWLIRSFFRKKRYLNYLIFTALLIVIFGRIFEWFFVNVIYAEEEGVILFGELSLLLLILASTGIKAIIDIYLLKNKEIRIESDKVKAELGVLKMQVNPHFLFNSLNNIYGLIHENPEKAGTSVLSLSGLLRYLTDVARKETVKLTDEIDFIRQFIEMEKLRLGDKCEVKFDFPNEVGNIAIPPLLLIPFVENSFKHGSYSTVGKSFIFIKLEILKGTISFSVSNSYNKDGKTKELSGVGLANIKRRLALLYPHKHQLTIEPKDNIFNIHLEITTT